MQIIANCGELDMSFRVILGLRLILFEQLFDRCSFFKST